MSRKEIELERLRDNVAQIAAMEASIAKKLVALVDAGEDLSTALMELSPNSSYAETVVLRWEAARDAL